MNNSTADQQLEGAVSLYRSAQFSEAYALCQRILDEVPDHPHTLNLLASICVAQNQLQQALDNSERAVSLAPQDAVIQSGRSHVLYVCEQFEQSVAAANAALALNPNLAVAHLNKGKALVNLFQFSDASAAFNRALAIEPDLETAVKENLVVLAVEQGRYETARILINKLLEAHPNDNGLAWVRSRYALNTQSVSRAEEREINERYWSTRRDRPKPYTEWPIHNLNKGDKLRIGFVSADFKRHPVSYFLRPVLEKRSPDTTFTKLYDVSTERDDFSEQLRTLADSYWDGSQQTDEELAETIYNDEIDILIDLTGMHKDSRTSVLRHRAAPVQASWIGYSGTSGLKDVDYVIADGHVCPEGADSDFTETIVRLPDHYLCFSPPNINAWPTQPPMIQNRRVTFGSFNNTTKVSSDVISVWANILSRVPNSMLHLKSNRLQNPLLREHIAKQFESYGIQKDRLILRSFVERDAHFNAYNAIDIALDPFPYCGTTTTVETLWMGVPVVTLVGERWIQRTSYGFLKGVGLEELCTYSEKEYIDAACALADDIERLSSYKRELRERLEMSPICDAAMFTLNFEKALRNMWETHHRSQSN